MFTEMQPIVINNTKKTLKDIFYNKVFNTSGYSIYSISGWNERCTVNEGQVAIDTTNKTVYIYVDLTIITDKTTTDWWSVVTLNNLGIDYLPKGLTNSQSIDRYQALITDENSPVYKPLITLVHTSGQNAVLMSPYGYGLTTNDRYICYGSWQYL